MNCPGLTPVPAASLDIAIGKAVTVVLPNERGVPFQLSAKPPPGRMMIDGSTLTPQRRGSATIYITGSRLCGPRLRSCELARLTIT